MEILLHQHLKKGIFWVQFHPEKSHKYGQQVFKNFTSINDKEE